MYRFERDAYEKRMRWFREARFGLFLHWGLYAIPARGEYAYTMLDLDHTPSAHAVEELKKINGVIRVRVIR